MNRMRVVVLGAMVAMTLAGCADDADDPSPQASASVAATTSAPTPPTKVAVRGGVNDPADLNIAALAFLPAEVKVVAGAAVSWTVAGPEPHSVTFLPPGQQAPTPDKAGALFAPTPPKGPYDGTTLVNSGLGPQGPGAPMTFDVTFAKAGTYAYLCVIHPQMRGTVVVGEPSAADTQSAIDERGKAEESQWLAEGQAAKKALVEKPAAQTKNSDGSTTWTVQTGVSTPHTNVLAFVSPALALKPGDSVTFVNGSAAPHTATFAGGTVIPPNPEDPKVLAPAPGKSPQTLKATGYFNTGWLPPDAPPGAGPPLPARSFTFVVPRAGSYAYICALHVASGMAGTLTAV